MSGKSRSASFSAEAFRIRRFFSSLETPLLFMFAPRSMSREIALRPFSRSSSRVSIFVNTTNSLMARYFAIANSLLLMPINRDVKPGLTISLVLPPFMMGLYSSLVLSTFNGLSGLNFNGFVHILEASFGFQTSCCTNRIFANSSVDSPLVVSSFESTMYSSFIDSSLFFIFTSSLLNGGLTAKLDSANVFASFANYFSCSSKVFLFTSRTVSCTSISLLTSFDSFFTFIVVGSTNFSLSLFSVFFFVFIIEASKRIVSSLRFDSLSILPVKGPTTMFALAALRIFLTSLF
mmetsp:Transcript_25938/g.29872  ORF Transcript_25938/g.29872 Transcript_25938/m.29872 type:complete len:291 (-) Transcript_25938:3021-3893(-)